MSDRKRADVLEKIPTGIEGFDDISAWASLPAIAPWSRRYWPALQLDLMLISQNRGPIHR